LIKAERRPNAVPVYFSSMRMGTQGQMAAGTSENATPIIRVVAIGVNPVRATIRNAGTNNNVPAVAVLYSDEKRAEKRETVALLT
jgi:hypothetical protein